MTLTLTQAAQFPCANLPVLSTKQVNDNTSTLWFGARCCVTIWPPKWFPGQYTILQSEFPCGCEHQGESGNSLSEKEVRINIKISKTEVDSQYLVSVQGQYKILNPYIGILEKKIKQNFNYKLHKLYEVLEWIMKFGFK